MCGGAARSWIDRLNVNAGRHYIRVGGYRDSAGTARFDLVFSAYGDECDNATEIEVGVAVPFDTMAMSPSPEPAESGDCGWT